MFGHLSFSQMPPMPPADADFAVTIDFQKGRANPSNVFAALATFLEGFAELDEVVLGAADPDFVPLMVLEDVEAASVTAWVRTKLRQTNDEIIKSGEYKTVVGAVLHAAKYRALKYLDDRHQMQRKQRLEQLRDDLQDLANSAELGPMKLPGPITLEALAKPLDRIQEGKGLLTPGDRAILKSDGREHEFDLTSIDRPSDVIGEETPPRETAGSMRMVLLVRKPDFLGRTKWEFRHGQNTIHAAILDEAWLERFRRGAEQVLPGSALECNVQYLYGYDAGGGLVSAKHDIIEVSRVIPPTGGQGTLFSPA